MWLQLGIFGLALSLTSTVSAASLDSITEGVSGAIVGVLASAKADSPVPLRRSITELAAEAGPQWDLYIQALRSMSDRDVSHPESFFQIAGIHGRPFIEYNNAGATSATSWGGYSAHVENLFIIWHRVYVSLFEQVLVKQAKSLAAGYPENVRSTYQKAADDLRAPYWDWALEPDLPSVILPETITAKVATETGVVAKDIVNPLYTYIFPKETLNGKFGQFQPGERIYRCSTTTQANNNLHNSSLKASLFDAFVRAKSFSDFSTYSEVGNSVEGVHNSVHLDAGCAGQFIDSEYSAFDPLFMLHHANVDRLWAYWQSIHPEMSTFNGTYSGKSRFNSAEGTMITLDSPLQPFRQVNGEWHTSSTVNDIKVLGYAYQGLEYWTKSAAEMQASALKTVNSLYGDKEEEKTTEPSSKESAVTTSQESTVTTSAVTTSAVTTSAVTTSQESTVTTSAVTTSAVTTSAATTSAVTTSQESIVTTSAVTTSAVTTSQESTVTTSTVTTSAVTTSAVTTSAVTTSAAITSAVATSAVATSAVTTSQESTVTTSTVTTSAVTTSAVTTSEVTTSAVTTSAVTTSAVTTSAVTTSAVTTSQESTVTTSVVTTSTVTTSAAITSAVATSAVTTSQESTVTTSTVTTSAATTSAVTTSQQSAVTTSQQSTVTTSTVTTSAVTTSAVTTSQQSAVTTSQQSIETGNTQSIPPQPKGTTTSILTSSKPSENKGSSAVSSSTAAETSSPLTTSSSQPGHGACIATSTTTSMAARAHAALKVRAKGSYKRFYAGIAVDVAYLPVRPCQIEIFLDKWRAGSMAIMKMPERGVVHDSISLKDAIASAKLGGVADDELLRRIQTRISVNLRKPDGGSISVTELSGLKVEVEVVEMVAASSDLELPTVIKSDKHVVLDKSVSGSAAQ